MAIAPLSSHPRQSAPARRTFILSLVLTATLAQPLYLFTIFIWTRLNADLDMLFFFLSQPMLSGVFTIGWASIHTWLVTRSWVLPQLKQPFLLGTGVTASIVFLTQYIVGYLVNDTDRTSLVAQFFFQLVEQPLGWLNFTVTIGVGLSSLILVWRTQ